MNDEHLHHCSCGDAVPFCLCVDLCHGECIPASALADALARDANSDCTQQRSWMEVAVDVLDRLRADGYTITRLDP